MSADGRSFVEAPVSSMSARLSPELRFVAECVRRSCGASPRQLPTTPEWEKILEHTAAQGVYPSVDAALQSRRVVAPERIRTLVSMGARMAVLERQRQQEPGIRLALSTLLAAGCTPVVLKGVALAYSRYVRPEHRLFSDIDLLLPVGQLARANAALLHAGFVVHDADHPLVGHQHLPPLMAPDRSILVELHRTLFDDACPFTVRVDELLARARPLRLFGMPVGELAPVDALLHACGHLSYVHRYARLPLRSLADVLVITRSGDVDWRDFVVRARRARMQGAVFWPLALARAWLGAPVPAPVLKALASPRPVHRVLSPVMYSGYVLDRSTVGDDGNRVLYDLLLELSIFSGCTPARQAGTMLRGLFPPPDAVTHLAPHITASPERYALELVRLPRLWRGISALGRLIAASRASGRTP
jgi:hypothetical protein